MTLTDLIDAAKTKQGSLGAVANALGVHQARLSHWKAGKYKPEASTIAQLAELAHLPVLETVAEIEAELHPEARAVWEAALGKLRAAGVAAAILMTVTPALLLAPTNDAKAAGGADRLCIM